jgi:Spy/CpxP family protein refolding chaperone
MVGFEPDEVRTDEPTRSARLKWVIVIDRALPPGRAVNAAVCVAASTSNAVDGLLGPDGKDAAGSAHPGLPWAGCTILAATGEQLHELRDKATAAEDVFVADMPAAAQQTRVYDEYLQELGAAAQIDYYAVSLVGPRNRIDKYVKRLSLLP